MNIFLYIFLSNRLINSGERIQAPYLCCVSKPIHIYLRNRELVPPDRPTKPAAISIQSTPNWFTIAMAMSRPPLAREKRQGNRRTKLRLLPQKPVPNKRHQRDY